MLSRPPSLLGKTCSHRLTQKEDVVGPGVSAVAGVVRVGGGGLGVSGVRSSAVFTHVCVVVWSSLVFAPLKEMRQPRDGNPDNVVSAAVKRSSQRFSPIYPPGVE